MRLDPFSFVFAFVLIFGALAAVHQYDVRPDVYYVSGDTVPLEPLVDAVAEAIKDEPMAGKPTMSQVVGASLWGIDFSELHTKNENDETLSTTPLEALDETLAAAERSEEYSQNIYVYNGDDTDSLCVGATTWGDTCGAGDMTCRAGATTDGNVIRPLTGRVLRYTGTERPCIQGSGAISSYDVERVTYKGPVR